MVDTALIPDGVPKFKNFKGCGQLRFRRAFTTRGEAEKEISWLKHQKAKYAKIHTLRKGAKGYGTHSYKYIVYWRRGR